MVLTVVKLFIKSDNFLSFLFLWAQSSGYFRTHTRVGRKGGLVLVGVEGGGGQDNRPSHGVRRGADV